MADVELHGEGGEGESAVEPLVDAGKPPNDQTDQSPGNPLPDMSANTDRSGGKDGEARTKSRARTMIVTPSGGETGIGDEDTGVTPLSSTGRRVSWGVIKAQLGTRETSMEASDELRVPGGDRYTPSASGSPSSTPIPPRPPSDYGSECSFRSRPGLPWARRRRDSEWVFRPLKLKFKVKELEELYRNYVYRQQQSLVCTACLIMVFISLMVAIFFFANKKVCSTIAV